MSASTSTRLAAGQGERQSRSQSVVGRPQLTVRFLLTLVACFAIASCGSRSEATASETVRILFVGNSLTYVGNLPAVFDALSGANDRASASDMIVTGGATLTDRLSDGSVAAALAEGKYSYVVLQERGGDFACGFGPDVCANSRASLIALAELIRSNNAIPILLGTYQGHPQASQSIVDTESRAAQEAGVDYIAISERLQKLRSTLPDMNWLASDGMHPGSDLTLLDALLLFERIHGAKPTNVSFSVAAPIYTFMSPLTPEVRPASAPAEHLDTPMSVRYDSDRVAALVEKLE